jgi:hypothetical protein
LCGPSFKQAGSSNGNGHTIGSQCRSGAGTRHPELA